MSCNEGLSADQTGPAETSDGLKTANLISRVADEDKVER